MKNILLFIADDLGRDTGYFGNPVVKTPNLDAFAEEGVCFDQGFCTTATCSASRSDVFTGLHNHQTGHYGHCHWYNHFLTFRTIETAPKIFNEAGYLTAIIGKIHVGPDDVYPWEIRREGFQRNRDVQAMSLAAREVFRRSKDTPFFLTIGFGDTHRDFTRGGFANKDYPGVDRMRFSPNEVIVPSFLPDLPEVRQELAEYYESAYRLDQGFRMIMEELERAGHAKDTLVMFISDNGIPFLNSKTTLFEPGIRLPMFMKVPGGKGGIRNSNMVSYLDILPTFMDWAGIESKHDSAETGGPDKYWKAGVPGPNPRRKGRSLLSVYDREQELEEWSEVRCSHTFHEITNYYPTRVLRTRKYKYHKNMVWKTDFPFASDLYASLTWAGIKRTGIRKIGQRPVSGYLQRPHEELYDLENDPDELVNLAGRNAYRDTLAQMREKVEAWQDETDDPWLFRDGVSIKPLRKYFAEGLQVPEGPEMSY